jgi:hypothetical protein
MSPDRDGILFLLGGPRLPFSLPVCIAVRTLRFPAYLTK